MVADSWEYNATIQGQINDLGAAMKAELDA